MNGMRKRKTSNEQEFGVWERIANKKLQQYNTLCKRGKQWALKSDS